MLEVVKHPVRENLLVIEQFQRDLDAGGGDPVDVEGRLPLGGGTGRHHRFHPRPQRRIVAHLGLTVARRALVNFVRHPQGPHERALEAQTHAGHRDRGIPRRVGSIVDAGHRRRPERGRDGMLLGDGRASCPEPREGLE